MRHVIGLALLTAALVTPAIAQDKGKEDEKLVGTWTLVSVESKGGIQLFDAGFTTYAFSKDGKLVVDVKGTGASEFKVVLDQTRSPKEIDMISKESTYKSIYKGCNCCSYSLHKCLCTNKLGQAFLWLYILTYYRPYFTSHCSISRYANRFVGTAVAPIYKLDGDSLKIAQGDNKVRPTAFDAKATVLTFKRQKP